MAPYLVGSGKPLNNSKTDWTRYISIVAVAIGKNQCITLAYNYFHNFYFWFSMNWYVIWYYIAKLIHSCNLKMKIWVVLVSPKPFNLPASNYPGSVRYCTSATDANIENTTCLFPCLYKNIGFIMMEYHQKSL